MKKVLEWYNLLKTADALDFEEEEEKDMKEAEDAPGSEAKGTKPVTKNRQPKQSFLLPGQQNRLQPKLPGRFSTQPRNSANQAADPKKGIGLYTGLFQKPGG